MTEPPRVWAGHELEAGVRLVRQVGTGSHSVVYLGFTRAGQPCTVKLFRPDMEEHAQLEYRAASQFDHPNLARALLTARIGVTPVVVLSWVSGQTLFRSFMGSGEVGGTSPKPALERAPTAYLTALCGVLAGLDEMHRLGLLHRDIKSENILVQRSGHATLIDYDLAAPFTVSGGASMQVGTPAFRSPEAARGEQLTPASDLYGVGLLLAWGLTGSLPSQGDPVQDASQRAEPFVQRPEQGPLWDLAAQLLQRDPAQRPQSAAEVIAILEQFSTLQ